MFRSEAALKYAYDVRGASPRGPAAGPVNVMLGLRTADGQLITGELTVPPERWDMAAFLVYWDQIGAQPS